MCDMDHVLICAIYKQMENDHLEPHNQKYSRLVIYLHLDASGPCLDFMQKFFIHTSVSTREVRSWGQAVKKV